MIKTVLVTFFLSNIFLFLSGCDFEANAMRLPLNIEIQGNNSVCLYTNNQRSFLGSSDSYLIYTGLAKSTVSKNNFEKKITLQEHPFPLKKEDCFLIPVKLFQENIPYDFILDSGKSFSIRACILRKGDGYEVKKVHSTENCDE
ncbi:NF045616 family extracytoplasmic (lipo)protein [Acinetobacter puyangensis]|uniref:NF045616 family extracytoplasmic (lipo)protein n=1 Tax=Acinetobacter puyangensis TaxID=1096779 RepID=UPI003A4DD882